MCAAREARRRGDAPSSGTCAELVLNAPDLISLRLSGCFSLTDAGVAHKHNFGELRELSLSDAECITTSAK